MELPDWLRGLVLIGRDGAEYRVVALDADGNMGVILQAAAEVTIPGDVSVDQNDSIREMQGVEGVTLRTVAVDANGQIIMVPRSQAGNYMTVDANGFLSTLMKGIEGANLRTLAVDANGNMISVIKGLEGANLRNIAVDANGQIIMVPRGATGNYMAVDASGYLGAILMADAAVTIADNLTVEQDDSIREMQGKEGVNLRTVAVDANGQIIMVPRGSTGNYLGVDASGYMTTVMKGTYGAVLKTLAADDEGYLVALLKDNSDQWGEKVSVGLAELAARLGSPICWERRGQVAQIVTFADGFGHMAITESAGGGEVALCPSLFQTGGYSCQITNGTGGAQNAAITTYGDYSPADRLGFEVVFSFTSQVDMLYFLFKVWDGVDEHRAYARVNNGTNRIDIMDETATYVEVGHFGPVEVPYLFYSLKAVFDKSTKEWVRLLIRGHEFDISAVETWSSVVGAGPYFSFQVLADHNAAVNKVMQLDRMIITTNEP